MNSHPSVERILPSFLKRKGFSKQSVAKSPKVVKTGDCDILCIPKDGMTESSAAVFSYPRGKYRAKLATYGLIGKLHLAPI